MSAPEEGHKPLWNSLEVTKILVGVLTPLSIFFFTIENNKATTEAAEKKAAQEKVEIRERERFAQVAKERIRLWAEISPQMNDLYCYFLYVGHWKEITPTDVLKTKRSLDKLIYSNSPFFSSDFLSRYQSFMKAAFQTENGWGEDAKLKSPPIRPKDKGLEMMFLHSKNGYQDNSDAIHAAYYAWLTYAATEMDLEVKTPPKPRTPSTSEIQERLPSKDSNKEISTTK
ncbi:MAG: hypothetical protein JSR83_01035 [Proteobacteria bacterium]|nr:hypothetical protein [Pseudomonadota bacterium]